MAPAYFYVGQRLTDYANVDITVEREASGGFGAVAMGPDRGKAATGQWRAIKALRPDLLANNDKATEQRLRDLFLREALTWRGFWPHANLLTAQFVTEINGQLMLVLDYAEQGSLRDLFEDSRHSGNWLTVEAGLSFAQQIAAGLVALHTPATELLRPHPVVHRDLKPENILINRHQYAMITDFGLAKAVAEALAPTGGTPLEPGGAPLVTHGANTAHGPVESTRTQVYHTQRGAMLGTPAYMAPEQWMDAALAGRPADAYAFGIILAELLTSRHPLIDMRKPHSLAEWRTAHASGQPIPLTKLGADMFAVERNAQSDATGLARLDAAIRRTERLLARLLAKAPQARPTLDEALRELQAAAADLGVEPYSPPDVYPHTTEHQRIFWQGWAGAYYGFKLYEEAESRIERARALAPRYPAVLISQANILMGMGRMDDAVTIYRQALTELPEDDIQGRDITLNQLGNALLRMKRYRDADDVYADQLRLMPDDAAGWYNRAANQGLWSESEEDAGHRSAAREHAQRGLEYAEQAMRLNGDDPDIRALVAALRRLCDAL